jgi:hypothetical protein
MNLLILKVRIYNELLAFQLHKPITDTVESIEKLIEEQAEIKANEKYKAICDATDKLFRP